MNEMETLADLLESAAARGDTPALIAFQADGKRTLSFAQLAQRARRLACTLVSQDLRRGETVLIAGPNSPEWIISYFGILLAGGTPVPLDAQYGAKDAARVVRDCGARRAFAAASHAEILRAAGGGQPLDIHVWDAPGAPDQSTIPETPPISGAALPRLEPDDTASLLYTSGTTGTPKAVPLSHRNLLSNTRALATASLAGPDDRVMLPLPLHHAYPFTAGLLACLATGAALVLPAGVLGPQLTLPLREAQVSVMIGVPRLYAALFDGIESRVQAQGRLSRLLFRPLLSLSILIRRVSGLRAGRCIFHRLHRELAPFLRLLASGGAHLDEALAWKLEGLGWEVLSGYGLTETSPIVCFNPHGRARLDTAGRPLPGVELRIAAAEGGRDGEIQVRGPNVFSGYRNNRQATEAVFTEDGWFRTGDLGWIDPEGYLHVTGRLKEIIVLPDGKKAVPEEVEQAYAASPLIREVAVFERGGRITGLIVPDEEQMRQHGTASMERLLREAVEDASLLLPPYQRLTDYRLSRAGLPRTHLGKLRRFLLPGLYEQAEHGIRPAPPDELSATDRQLLADERVKPVWDWLCARFAGLPVTLDASPQLDLHVDSLEWVTLTLELQRRFGIVLDEDAPGRIITVRDLLNEVASSKTETAPPGDVRQVSPAAMEGLNPSGGVTGLVGRFLLALNRLIMRLVFRLSVSGLENLPATGGIVLTPNHASYLDAPALAAALPGNMLRRTWWAAWRGLLFTTAARSFFSRALRIFPVDPDRDPARGLALASTALSHGAILVWFPEGRRSPDGRVHAFSAGIGALIQQSGVSAAPVLIKGSFEALPRGKWRPAFHPIRVIIGKPSSATDLEARGAGEDAAARIASALRQAVLALDGSAG